jgi:hypothetical protein
MTINRKERHKENHGFMDVVVVGRREMTQVVASHKLQAIPRGIPHDCNTYDKGYIHKPYVNLESCKFFGRYSCVTGLETPWEVKTAAHAVDETSCSFDKQVTNRARTDSHE